MMKLVKSLVPWLLLCLACVVVYTWNQMTHVPPEPPGYRESVRRRATGNRLDILLDYWNRQPTGEAMEIQ